VYLVRAVMGKEILDRGGFKGGKVDDILLEMHDDEPPVVRAILTQHGAVARVLGRRVARWAEWARARTLGFGPDVAPIEIGWEHVTRIDVTVHVDLDRHDGGLMRSERALWERWISRLPLANR
jgi:sporulation protein YlmC with PRC-barrel domain